MTERSEPKVAGLLLAAGGSSRLGRPKQLVEFRGKTLIRRAAESLIEAGCSPVVVVLGGEIDGSSRALDCLDVEIVVNENWEDGVGSSIARGIERILEIAPSSDAVLITLCDQPHVTGEKLRPFLERFSHESAAVIAAEYDGLVGVPALFPKVLFPKLRALTGDKGAREIIRNSPDAMTIPLPEAGIDIDTPNDFEALPDHRDRSDED